MITDIIPVEYEISEVNANSVLRTLQKSALQVTEELVADSAFANVFIQRGDVFIFVECRVDTTEQEVHYMVCVNPDENAEYPLVTFDAARRELNALLKSEVLF